MANSTETAANKSDKSQDTFFEGGWEDAAPKRFWGIVEEGTEFCGIPKDREERLEKEKDKDKDAQFILTLEITNPGNLQVQKGSKRTDDKEILAAEKGMLVSIDERARLRAVGDLGGDEKQEWEVKMMALGKIDIGDGHTMWNFKVGRRKIVAGRRVIK